MARVTTKAKCNFCQAEFSKGGINKHLDVCPVRQAAIEKEGSGKTAPEPLWHLKVEGRDDPDYWMHLELPAALPLTKLDAFLRETWVECCGHLSAFQIGPDSYQSSPYEVGDKGMRSRLDKVLGVGEKFGYEYDFGTTTELKLEVVGQRQGGVKKGQPITILARNEPPDIKCETCRNQPAAQVCTNCIWSGENAWFCEECAEEHECGEESFLPVVNSPRVGMCGYEG